MAITVNGSKYISLHSSFWNALTKNSDSLALSQLWLCSIDKDTLRNIISTINANIDNYEQHSWENIQGVGDTILNDANWDSADPSATSGSIYLLVRGISFIGDGIGTSRVGVSQTGAHKGLISDGRTELSTTNITFLETNVSFVDGILRPWSVLVGYRSLKDQSLRCDIEMFALEKWEPGQPLKVRKSLVLKNAVPVNIDTEEYNYSGDKLIDRQVQFAFDRYEMRVNPTITEMGAIDAEITYNEKTSEITNATVNANIKNNEENEMSILTNEDVNQKEDLQNIGGPITYINNGNLFNFSPLPWWHKNPYQHDHPVIYLDRNRYPIDNPSINLDTNANIVDSPSINTDMNTNLLDSSLITPDMNANIKDNTVIAIDINPIIPDTPNINQDINLNTTDVSNIRTDINISVEDNASIKLSTQPSIIDNQKIKYTESPYILDNRPIGSININQNTTSNVGITFNENPNTSDINTSGISNLSTGSKIVYNEKPYIVDTSVNISWTPVKPLANSSIIVSDIHANDTNTTAVRMQ